ncbi:MAG: glycosyltransferase [Deltaproteobacteria bacterium]|nr:glycosyltransferase [Deltaproteobacteria bacterium]
MSEFLMAEIPAGTSVFRIGNPYFGQTINARLGRKIVGNSSLPWGLSVSWQGWKKIRQSKPDLIFVNTPPFTNVAVGMILAGLFSVPLVVDMKDDWVGSPAYWKKGRLRRRFENWVERQVMGKVSAAIIVTRSSYDTWIQRYSKPVLARKIFFIPNGEDLEEYRILWDRKRKPESDRIRLLSAAAGYRPDYRDLTPFLQALELFLERFPKARDQMDIEMAGEEPDDFYKTWFDRLIPAASVHYTGVLDRQALVESLWQADLFFLIQPRQNFTAISSTLYEYWAVGKAPVLLFAETGASSSLVVDNHLGAHFQFNQVEEASRYIERVYQAFCERQPIWIERSGAEAYDRRKTAQQMLSIWSDTIDFFHRH